MLFLNDPGVLLHFLLCFFFYNSSQDVFLLSLVDAVHCFRLRAIWDEEEKTKNGVLRNQQQKYEKSLLVPDSHRHRRLLMVNQWKLLLTTSAFLCASL